MRVINLVFVQWNIFIMASQDRLLVRMAFGNKTLYNPNTSSKKKVLS